MNKDRAPVDPDLFGISVTVPTVPLKVCDGKTAKAEAGSLRSELVEVEAANPKTLTWKERLSRLAPRLNS